MGPAALLSVDPFRPCGIFLSPNSTSTRTDISHGYFSTIKPISFNLNVNPDIIRQIAWLNFRLYGTYRWSVLVLISRGPKLNSWLRRVVFRNILPDHPENIRSMIRDLL